MKQKQDKTISQAGFTIVELLAVLAIMTLLMGALVLDFASQRGKRNIVLAKNETITNLRKVQSYTLSSKNLPTGESVKYYIATFSAGANSFTVDAIDSDYVFHPAVETIALPSAISIENITTIDNKDSGQGTKSEVAGGGVVRDISTGIAQDKGGVYKCMQIIFSAPFGKIYTNGSSVCGDSVINSLRDPVQRAELSEKTARIYFNETSENIAKSPSYLEVVPVTGQMTIY